MDCVWLAERGEGGVCLHVVRGGGEEEGGKVAAVGDWGRGVLAVVGWGGEGEGKLKPMHQSRFRSAL